MICGGKAFETRGVRHRPGLQRAETIGWLLIPRARTWVGSTRNRGRRWHVRMRRGLSSARWRPRLTSPSASWTTRPDHPGRLDRRSKRQRPKSWSARRTSIPAEDYVRRVEALASTARRTSAVNGRSAVGAAPSRHPSPKPDRTCWAPGRAHRTGGGPGLSRPYRSARPSSCPRRRRADETSHQRGLRVQPSLPGRA
jgi:hypothetical protein